MPRELIKQVGPQIVACTRCRDVIPNAGLRLRHLGHAYCAECARYVGLVTDVERDPKKMGGHTYKGPA